MSSCSKRIIECPKCRQKTEYDYWETVNVDLNPELKEEVFNQNIFRLHCSCGCNDVILHPLFYHNMKMNYMISFCSITEVEDIKKYYREIETKIPLGERYRITINYEDFIDKINILDSGFDDKLIEYQKYIAYEALKKKGKDIRDTISIFSAPDKNCKDYYLEFIDLSNDTDNCFIFPIQKDWFEKHTQLISAKEKSIDEVFYVIDQSWANLMVGNVYYHGKNSYIKIIESYQNEVKQKYKVEYNYEDINKTENDDTLLKLAVIADDYDRVKELLEKGADPNLQPEKGKIALHYALQYGASKEIIALLIEYGSEINTCTKKKPKPLDLIYPNCSVEYLDYVFSLGAECNKDELIRKFASKSSDINIIDYLIDKGFSLDTKDSYDMNVTAHVICNNEDNDFLEKYLASYGTPNEKYNGGPCFFNEIKGYDDIKRSNGYYAKRLKILFDHGADVNITNRRNQTPMMMACLFAHDDNTIRFLLSYNPDLTIIDDEGKDVFDYLEKNEYLSDRLKDKIRQLMLLEE